MTDLFGDAPIERPVQAHRRELGGTDVWLTPPWLLDALGSFDLDPCAAPEPRPWPTAREHYTADVDGLRQPWHGRCWVNPPYSDNEPWLARLADHGHGTALIFARTETAAFHRQVWSRADALLFLKGRITFHLPDGRPGRFNGGAPSVLVAYGRGDAEVLAGLAVEGAFVHLGKRAGATNHSPSPSGASLHCYECKRDIAGVDDVGGAVDFAFARFPICRRCSERAA